MAFRDCDQLIEIINNSSLGLTAGSEDHGAIAYRALSIKKGGKSDIASYRNYTFLDGVNGVYMIAYTGEGSALTLPDGYKGKSYILCQARIIRTMV